MNVNQTLIGGFLCVFIAISGCGKSAKKNAHVTPSVFGAAISTVAGMLKPSAKPVDPRTQITRQAIDASAVPVLFASIKSRNAFATLSSAGKNRDVETWVSADGISLSFKRGIVVATRGLGHDLMAADTSDVFKVINAGRGDAIRIHDYLNGEDQIYQRSFYCTVRTRGREVLHIFEVDTSTRHVIESCNNPEMTLENHYWIANSGKVIQSKQWVGPEIQYVFTQQLSR